MFATGKLPGKQITEANGRTNTDKEILFFGRNT